MPATLIVAGILVPTLHRWLRKPTSSCQAASSLVGHPSLSLPLRERLVYRAIALAHPTTASEALAAGAFSAHWLERFAVARNPTTPPKNVAPLTEDGNRLVRAAARAQSVGM